MQDILKKLSEPLAKEDVELRVGQVNANGFSLLLYKTARVDIKRLNDSGAIWTNEHKYDDKNLLKCVISVYDAEHKIWIPREDIGRESNTEAEKGNYSDSFKRAGFRWGIGLELYNSPFIWINAFQIKKDSRGKNAPDGFFASNLVITEYEVEEGHFTKFTLEYKGKGVIFSMDKSKKPASKPKQEAKPANNQNETPPTNQEVVLATPDDVLTIESLISSTNSDKVKFLQAFKVERLDDLPKQHVEQAITLLTKKTKGVA